MRREIGVGLVIVLSSLAGCSSSGAHVAKGTLTGGIAPSTTRSPASYFEGRVEVLGNGKVVASKSLSLLTTRTYTIRLAPGRYTLRAAVSQFQPGACGGTATIVANRTTHADVVCQVP